MTTTPTDNVRAVYLGPCQIEGGKKGNLWIPVDVLDANPDASRAKLFELASAYSAKRNTFVVGGIYEALGSVEAGHLKTFTQTATRFVGRAEHKTLAELQAVAATEAMQANAKSAERKLREEPHLMEEIKGLRRLYWKTSPASRPAFECAILRLLRMGA